MSLLKDLLATLASEGTLLQQQDEGSYVMTSFHTEPVTPPVVVRISDAALDRYLKALEGPVDTSPWPDQSVEIVAWRFMLTHFDETVDAHYGPLNSVSLQEFGFVADPPPLVHVYNPTGATSPEELSWSSSPGAD